MVRRPRSRVERPTRTRGAALSRARQTRRVARRPRVRTRRQVLPARLPATRRLRSADRQLDAGGQPVAAAVGSLLEPGAVDGDRAQVVDALAEHLVVDRRRQPGGA